MQVLEPFVVDKELETNHKAFMDETLLHVCAIYGSPKVCSWLLGVEDKKGRTLANPAAKDKNGWAPIHYAARFGHNDVLQMLRRVHRNQVEQLFLRDAKPYADPVTEDGWAPLHVAARFEQIDIITSLLKSGAAKEAKVIRIVCVSLLRSSSASSSISSIRARIFSAIDSGFVFPVSSAYIRMYTETDTRY